MGIRPKSHRHLLSELFELAAEYRETLNLRKELYPDKPMTETNGEVLAHELRELDKSIAQKEQDCRDQGIEQKELDAILHFWKIQKKKK